MITKGWLNPSLRFANQWVCGCLLLWGSYLHAAENQIRVCGVEWPPFSYANPVEKRLERGISIAIYQEAFKRLDVKVEFIQLPWPRCERDVIHGKYDAILDNASLPGYIHPLIPTAFYPLGAYVKQGSPLTNFRWGETSDKRVGMVRGYDYTPKISEHLDWEITLSKSDEQLLLLLDRNRVDYIILDYFAAPILSKKTGVKIRPLNSFLDSTPLYLCFNKKHSALVDRLGPILLDMLLDGTLDKIYQKSLGDSYANIRKHSRMAAP
ncbi:substrate-binding periplasmic protein [Dongshaea marina]|uniref:substrate-binding periplasmic protein n=1 Tax=Dongshaea marina TaxID=2047966 RepID=UPI000D3E333A|nr:transporter substrate-binding domain-containing protein [Dongshaea marina]